MNTKGFTLIELSIVILIAGMLMIPAFQAYDIYMYGKRVNETKERIAKIQSEISIFAIKYDRYPCPSDRSLPPGHPQYGVENCSLATASTGCLGTDLALCVHTSDQDTDGVGGNDPILFGGVPFITIADLRSDVDPSLLTEFRRVAARDSVDGWHNQISYAVTSSQTIAATFDNQRGVIRMIDENGVSISADPNERMHFALIAHGRDGYGAFSSNGSRVRSCTSGVYGEPDGPAATPQNPAGTGTNRDFENCNMNATFIMGLDFSDAEGALHFDDISSYGTSNTSALWDSTRLPTGERTAHIRNLNTRNVGFGVSPPVTTLDVAGNIKAETKVRTQRVCDINGDNCFNTSVLTDTAIVPPSQGAETTTAGIRCASGRVMTGISRSQEQCSDAPVPTTWTEQRCPDVAGRKTWLRGVRTDGIIECTN